MESAPKRLWYLDNLRILLISLVVLHHVATMYGLGIWYYSEPPDSGAVSLVLTVFLLLNQAWFMGAFFLLSGYFTPGSLERKGPRAFLRDRLIRLGIPLLVYYFVLNPLLYLGSGHGYWDTIGSGPLWFVAALLVFDVGYAVFRWARKNPRPLTRSRVLVFVLVLALVTYVLRIVIPIGFWVPVVDFPTAAYLPQYLAFFVVGTLARTWTPVRMGRFGLGLAIGATVVFLPLALSGEWTGGGTLSSLFYALWDSSFAVGVVLALLSLFHRRFNATGRLRQYLSSRVFTVYVTHAVVVTAAGYALSALDLPTLAKFAIAAVVTVPACFLLAGPVRRLPGVRRVL